VRVRHLNLQCRKNSFCGFTRLVHRSRLAQTQHEDCAIAHKKAFYFYIKTVVLFLMQLPIDSTDCTQKLVYEVAASWMYFSAMAPKPTVARTAASKRILIVDDLPQMRKLMRAYLEEETEFRVCGEAIDGFDAINKAQELKPDLIILDASMPRMSGIEAAPKLKKLLPEARIILFTFHESMMHGFDASQIGVDAVVTKDRGMFPLKESVEFLLQRRHLSVRPNDDDAKAKR
jgi:CheY-like chemotaxis protein